MLQKGSVRLGIFYRSAVGLLIDRWGQRKLHDRERRLNRKRIRLILHDAGKTIVSPQNSELFGLQYTIIPSASSATSTNNKT